MMGKSKPIKVLTITVAWMLNGKTYSEDFESPTMAWIRMFQLQAYGLEPTMHSKELN